MTKSFIDEVREIHKSVGDLWDEHIKCGGSLKTFEAYQDARIHRYNKADKMAQRLIAIDDIVTEYIEFTNFTENAQANGVLKQIRQILEGATK